MSDEKAVTIVQPAAIQRHSMSDMQVMAKTMANSGLFPNVKTEQQAFALMLLCDAENIHPALALRRYHLINGTPAMKAETMLAEFKKLGGKVRWLRRDDRVVSATFHIGDEDSPVITWDDARVKQAGISNPNHGKFPMQMKTARVISEGIRLMAPGIVQGIYTPEEVTDWQHTDTPAPTFTVTEAPSSPATVPLPPTLYQRCKTETLTGSKLRELLTAGLSEGDTDALAALIGRCADMVRADAGKLPVLSRHLAPFAADVRIACPEAADALAVLGFAEQQAEEEVGDESH